MKKSVIAVLALLAVAGAEPLPKAHAQPAAPSVQVDARATVRAIATLIEENFYDAERARSIASDLRSQAAGGAYDAITNPHDLATRLSEFLRPHDTHFRVSWAAPTTTAPPRPEMSRVGARLMQASIRSNHGFRRVEMLPGQIGYIALDRFAPFDPGDSSAAPRATADAAMAMIAGARAVIIDLRDNVGGAPVMVSYLASYFVARGAPIYNTFRSRFGSMSEAPTIAPTGERRLDTPLYILISGRTGSAAEALAYTLQASGRATIVGEPSAGAANPGAFFATPQGFSVFIARGSPVNPITGRNWEGAGVQPDVAAPYDAALERAQILALEAILPSQNHEDAVAEMTWALEALREEGPVLDRRALLQFAGDYGERRIELVNDTLVVHQERRPPIRLRAISNDLFAAEGNPFVRYQFERDASGRILAFAQLTTSTDPSRHQRRS